MPVDWQNLNARRLEWMTTSVIRDIFKNIQSTDLISMAGGWPEADLFPVEQFREICDYLLQEMPRESLQYGVTDGFNRLRQTLAEAMTDEGIPCKEENVVITSGAQQGLDLVGRILLDEGDTIIVEEPTFLGALQSFRAYGVEFATVPLDGEGACADQLPAIIRQKHPKFMYLLPTFHNPTGVTMSMARREEVVEIASSMGVPIVEDDPYSQLRFAGEALAPLVAIDAARYPENGEESGYVKGDIIYLRTFSKTLAPGLRLAWAVCPPEIAEQFVMAKQGADLHTNALAQTMAYEFMRRGWLPAQEQRIRDTYLARRNTMCEAIEEYFPKSVRYTRPEGGLFLWVTLPEGMDAAELLREAAEKKVAFIPGGPFYANGGGDNTLRLSFASVPCDTIREGIKRLGAVMRARVGE
ncbi:MAG: PLP-dependent aminotransferase family protein [Chloroflexota bacterium]|nr:PLP-dependent aminotransferase family protein [Chloroflexota bacterium]